MNGTTSPSAFPTYLRLDDNGFMAGALKDMQIGNYRNWEQEICHDRQLRCWGLPLRSLAPLGRKSGYRQIHGWGDEAMKR
jgi:hypothetical protein